MSSTSETLPSDPFGSFLVALDHALTQPATLHLLGGFVVIYQYGAPRSTEDIDAVEIVPASGVQQMLAIAGRGSELHKKFSYLPGLRQCCNLPRRLRDPTGHNVRAVI